MYEAYLNTPSELLTKTEPYRKAESLPELLNEIMDCPTQTLRDLGPFGEIRLYSHFGWKFIGSVVRRGNGITFYKGGGLR